MIAPNTRLSRGPLFTSTPSSSNASTRDADRKPTVSLPTMLAAQLAMLAMGYAALRLTGALVTPDPPAPPPPPPPPPMLIDAATAPAGHAVYDTAPCDAASAGRLYFDTDTARFIGCDGTAWSQLAFCCAPERPAAPTLAVADRLGGVALNVSWVPPLARGSPVLAYTLYLSPRGDRTSAPERVCHTDTHRDGPLLSCVLTRLAKVDSPVAFFVVAHAPGGSSEPSEPTTLLPAPEPVSLVADDDGDCAYSTRDVLRLRFDVPTSQPLSAADGTLTADAVMSLLDFSLDVGEVVGAWTAPNELSLFPQDGTPPPAVDPYLGKLQVTVRPQARLLVSPPLHSPAASATSPPLHVLNCFLEGFELETGLSRWQRVDGGPIEVAEAEEAGSSETNDGVAGDDGGGEGYRIQLDGANPHSGSLALRVEGGSGGQFDGIYAELHAPRSSEPRRISFWMRAESLANVGYLALGGPSLRESVLFFHVRPSGEAGLLSRHGYFSAGNFSRGEWVHVELELDWSAHAVSLLLDGQPIAQGVPFFTHTPSAMRIHLFNSDAGLVWWDDFVVSY